MKYEHKCRGTCSRAIRIDLSDEGIINDVQIVDGCDGNGKGIAALARGRDMREVMTSLRGITCERKKTSCPDQLSLALQEALEEIEAGKKAAEAADR